MLTISTSENHFEDIQNIIDSIDRLDELVSLSKSAHNEDAFIFVENGKIHKPIDWYDSQPPYLFNEYNFTSEHLLAYIFFGLNNPQKALELLDENSAMYHDLSTAAKIQFAYEITEKEFYKIPSIHNQCIVKHYGNATSNHDSEELKQLYYKAITNEKEIEVKAFTTKHFSNFLIDLQLFVEAEKILAEAYNDQLSEEAKNTLSIQLALAQMHQLSIPFNTKRLEEIFKRFEEGIQFYERKQLHIQAGLLLIEASEIANYQKNFSTSKDLINKAIVYFKEEEITEFLGEASLRKAMLLYTWSKNGQPQYYKPAINAFQNALKVFKRELHPAKFAEIHHYMALIYSEIPVSPEEKPMWTAFCASSFKEALSYFNKESFPYDYAMIAHNYATALINFPEAKLHNNLDKAQQLFKDALAIRTSSLYPFERASTLINQIELYWLLHNETTTDENKKITEMLNKLNEIKTLTTDENILDKVRFHEQKIESLKTLL